MQKQDPTPSTGEGVFSMATGRAVIFANGEIEDLAALHAQLRPEDALISADGGLRHLRALGLEPQAVIGDLDSLVEGEEQRLAAAGVTLVRHPVDKDETDLELALAWAAGQGYRPILVAGALGGRIDQALGNIFLLARPELAACDLRLDDGRWELFLVRGQAEIHGAPGDRVSLLPFFGPAEGVVTRGLRYPLVGETLYPDRTRGISNVLLGEAGQVSLTAGTLLCAHQRQEPGGF